MASSMAKKLACVGLLLACTVLACAQSTVSRTVGSEKSGAFEFRRVVVPSDLFYRQQLISMSEEFLRESRNKHAAVLLVSVGQNQFESLFQGKEMYDFTWNDWQKSYEKLTQQGNWKIAQLVRLGHDATLRIRTDQGMEEIPISGDNVFHRVIGSKTVDLLWIEPVRKLARSDYRRLHAAIFVQVTPSVNPSDALQISEYLLRKVGSTDSEIHLRHDGWFVRSNSYPTLNPFDPGFHAVSASVVGNSAEFLCAPHQAQTCYELPAREN
jgi:hypothetical protein